MKVYATWLDIFIPDEPGTTVWLFNESVWLDIFIPDEPGTMVLFFLRFY